MSRTRALQLVAVLAFVAGTAAAFSETSRGRSARTEIRSLIATGYPVYCGGGTRPYVALTFDDGPNRWTPQLVDVLRANDARATFFEIGKNAAAQPDLVRLEATVAAMERGHGVYNVGAGAEVSLREAIAAFEALAGRPLELREHDAARGDPGRTSADTARIEAELGRRPRTGFEEGARAQ